MPSVRFFNAPEWLQRLVPSCLWRIPTEEKILYLTFDDGPIPEITEFVLDVLKKYQAKATFFCVGDNIKKHPQLAQQAYAAGHRVANHTFNHLKGWQTSLHQYLDNVQQCEKQLTETVGEQPEPKLFRPPYGRISPMQLRQLKEQYNIVMWDVLTNDYDASLQEEECLRESISRTRPGSIVVFHDSIKAAKNMQYVLPRYLEHFSKQGYRFLSL